MQGLIPTLEQETLNRHGKGAHKNDPGASKKVYGPIASLFSRSGGSADGKLRFGIGAYLGGSTPRAYIDCVQGGVRYYVCWVWQEDWSSPVSFGKKYMKGKVRACRGADGHIAPLKDIRHLAWRAYMRPSYLSPHAPCWWTRVPICGATGRLPEGR